MVKKIFPLILIISLWASFSASAQYLDKAFKYLNENKFEKAQKFFYKSIDKRQSLPVAYYGLSRIYNDSLYSGYDPYRAYKMIKKALYYYNKYNLNAKKYWKGKYNLDYKTLVAQHDSIVNKELAKALASRDILKINEFIVRYQQSPQADTARKFIDSVYFSEVIKQNTIEAYRKFIKENPQSYYVAQAKKRLDSLWSREFHKAYSSLELSTMERFEKKYPDYPYNADTVFYYKNLAIRARQLMLYMPYKPEFLGKYISFIKDAAPMEPAYLTLLKLIDPPLMKYHFLAAVDTLKKYKHYFPHNARIDTLISILLRDDPKLVKAPLKGQVNTPNGYELIPVLTADNKTLYFCGENRDDNLGNEDIYVSHYKNGLWQKPEVVTDLSTMFGNEAPLSVSADGNTLIFFSNGDVYMSNKTKTGWSEPKEIREINSDFWDADAFITADGNAILFVSDRPNPSGDYHPFNNYFHGGMIGNTDIWVVVRQGDHWSQPINLGQVINTPYAERTPFLHPDMHTLYFASDGHASLGSMDLFVSYRLSDTSWTQWSPPVNLGKWFNSPQKEYGYAVSTDGRVAYYALFDSVQSDIYTITMPRQARPEMVLTVYGYVSDVDSNKLEADIVWEDLSTGKELGRLRTDPQSGYYVIPLPEGKNYGFYVSCKGFYPVSDNINLSNYNGKNKIRHDFVLTPVKDIISKKSAVVLNNVFFDFDSDKLKPESYPELRRFAEFVKEHPDLKFEISGHTDSIGTTEYNKDLSLRRAQAVMRFLIKQGCSAKQFVVKGYGSEKPVATNKTEQGRSMNRRVEFRVIGRIEK